MKKEYKKLLWEVVTAAIIIAMIIGGIVLAYNKGWIPTMTKETFIEIPSGTGPGATTPTAIDLIDNCQELCESEDWADGWEALFDDGHDCIVSGATFAEYGYPNEDPLLSCCCDNLPEDEEPDEGYEEGDIVDTSNHAGGNGMPGGMNQFVDNINLEGWDYVEGGPYTLGVRIHRSWDYVNPDPDCLQTGFPDVVEWTFYDSNGLRWQVYDDVPTTTVEDICPVIYHPSSPWAFDVRNSKPVNCKIDWSWSLEVYICEVNE